MRTLKHLLTVADGGEWRTTQDSKPVKASKMPVAEFIGWCMIAVMAYVLAVLFLIVM